MNEKNIASTKNQDVKAPMMYLSATDILKIHTNIGQNLINGDWRIGKMGLIQFASLMNILQKATREDDPYAKWYLYKTFDALNNMQDKLQCFETSIHEQLNSLRGFDIEIYYNPTPLKSTIELFNTICKYCCKDY